MIVVTGAMGRLGSLVVGRLLKLVGPERVVASTREPGRAGNLASRGVRVRHGDFTDPSSLPQAFEGATQLLLVSSNAAASGGDPLAQHRAAIAAAAKAGVRRIVYTSHMGAGSASAFQPMRTHAATEAMLAASGLAWTALHNGFYASAVQQLIGDAIHTGLIEAPLDGPVCWTTHGDLAGAAARILADEGRFDGPTPPLTAARTHDLADIAGVLSALGGRSVERRTVTDAEEERRLAAGLPLAVIDIRLGFYRASRAGEFAATDTMLPTSWATRQCRSLWPAPPCRPTRRRCDPRPC